MSSEAKQAEVVREEVPAAARSVVSGHRLVDRAEKFVLTEDESAKHPPAPENFADIDASCAVCVKDFEDGDETIYSEDAGGNVHRACLVDAAGEFVEEPPEPATPLDQLLSSLHEESADVVIYLKRKPDPIGCVFKNPYNGPIKTIGEMTFDESFTHQAVIELNIGRLYGGGFFQVNIYRRSVNRYLKAWSVVVDDPVEAAPAGRQPAAAENPAAPTPGTGDLLGGLVHQAKQLREIVDAVGGSRRNEPRTDSAAIVPLNPIQQLQGSVEMVTSMMALARELRPEPPSPPLAAGGEGGERTWVDDAAKLSAAFGIGNFFQQVLTPIAGAWLQDKMQEAKLRQIQQSGRAIGGAQPSGAASGGAVGGSELGGSGTASAPGLGDVSRETSPTPAAQAVSPQVIDLLLRPIVADMLDQVAHCPEDEDFQPDNSVALTLQLLEMAGGEGQLFIREHVLLKSGLELVVWLGEVNLEWRLLKSSPDAIGYATFCEDYREALRDALGAQLQSAGTGPGSAENSPNAEPPDLHIVSDVSRETSGGGADGD